ncbi:hypothetical protein SEA_PHRAPPUCCINO_4 [Mycobacterium phage Phrappuccino]|uniref:Uncharacterized protein n=1 Tax=Mycobacterium phage Phrappuccino TaxID=2591223 RepID=A0A514DDJ6_9CAUD|nr:cysteine dioxygenase [Mycobacterium phage Phrappuccino]QDH91682.1 hypothetical protein SEA_PHRAPPUCCINO_4 [Mycobacterium phage Phrappuccino]QIQ63126.1 hypothetical protein SEA_SETTECANDELA_4 [Mycobacterium phage Settecandela]
MTAPAMLTTGQWWLQLWSGNPHITICYRDGSPYLQRWYLVPRNRFFNLYLHKFLRSDEDKELHCHPWNFVSFILKGSYIEVTEDGRRERKRFSIAYRRAETRHRVELLRTEAIPLDRNRPRPMETPAWTLVLTGPKIREWGFYCVTARDALGRIAEQRFIRWDRWVGGRGGCGEFA